MGWVFALQVADLLQSPALLMILQAPTGVIFELPSRSTTGCTSPTIKKKIKKYNNQNFQPLSSIIFLYKASLSQRVIQGSGVDSPALKL